MPWKHWNWLDNGILPIALIIMRVCVLWLGVTIAQQTLTPAYQGDLFPPGLMGGVLLLSLVTTRLSAYRLKSLARARLIVAGSGVVILFWLLWRLLYRIDYLLWDGRWLWVWGQDMLFWLGQLPPAYLVVVAFVYLWLRGIIDGSRLLEHRHVVNTFFAGVLGLAVLLLISAFNNQNLPAAAGSSIFLFFMTAAVALAFSSLKTARLHLGGPKQLQFGLSRYWGGSVLTIIGLLLGLGLLLSALLAPEIINSTAGWTWQIVSQVLLFLIKLTSLILYPLLYLLSVIIPPLLELIFSSFDSTWRFDREALLGGGGAFGPFGSWADAIENLPDELRWLGLVIVVVGLGLLFAIALQRLLSDANEAGVEEQREFIFSNRLFMAQLAQLWPAGLRHFRGNPDLDNHPFLSLRVERDPRRIIRQIYQQLLASGRDRGQPRLPNQTPTDYERDLSQTLPEAQDSLAIITKQYGQARYASDLPAPQQVEATQRAWQQLQRGFQNQDRG